MSRLLAVAVSLLASGVDAGPPPSRRVVVAAHGFSIEAPTGWEVNEHAAPAAIALVSPEEHQGDPVHENVIVIVERTPEPVDAERYLSASLARNADHVEVIERGTMSAGDWTAATVVYRAIDRPAPRTSLVAALRRADRAYLIMCYAAGERFAEIRPTFESVVQSFRFEDARPEPPSTASGGRYRCAKLGLSAWRPDGWEIIEDATASSLVFASPLEGDDDVFRELVSILVRDHPRPVSLDEVHGASLAAAADTYAGFEPHGSSDLDVDGWPTRTTVFSGTLQGIAVKGVLAFSVKDRRSFMVTCGTTPESFGRFQLTFDRVLRGLDFD